MKQIEIEIFNSIIETHFQFQKQHPGKKSVLFSEIQKVLKCDMSVAEEKAATHCNLISSYAPCRAKGWFNGLYSDFFSECLKSGYVNDKGYISNKPKMFKALKIETSLETFRDYEDILMSSFRLNPAKFYQVKIKANTSGDHFMACFVKNEVLYLSDTSYRGIGVKATDFITESNFQKITEIV